VYREVRAFLEVVVLGVVGIGSQRTSHYRGGGAHRLAHGLLVLGHAAGAGLLEGVSLDSGGGGLEVGVVFDPGGQGLPDQFMAVNGDDQ
jgi:hypothetical protein